MNPKTNYFHRFRYFFASLLLLFLLVISIVTILIVRFEQNQSIIDQNVTIEDNRSTISIGGLLTMKNVLQANVCRSDEPIEDCLLIYNAEILMKTLVLFPSLISDNASISINMTNDCKRLRIRRNQLSQIFDSQTLQTLYKLSGVSFLAAERIAKDSIETRSQIDARSLRNRWTSPINYFITTNTGLTPMMITTIRIAIANWQNNTCLTFNELTSITPITNRSYIRFERDDEYGCSSPVGYDPTDPTSTILLAAGCGQVLGTVMHEIGHTLGYIHTQSRIDRNNFINVVTANIAENFLGNFFIWSFGTIRFLDVSLPYDYSSLMHYNGYGFSKNGQPTITTLDPRYELTIGQREVATFYDYKSINRLYCTRTTCPQMFNGNSCQNNGYLDPRTCSRCICPEGFGGTFCDQRDTTSNCGGIITNPTPSQAAQITIENPIPTNTNPQLQYCVYHIQSQSVRRIRFRLDSINTVRSSVCLYNSSIEVRYRNDSALNGPRWCGRTVSSDWLNITAQTNLMVVIFRANNFLNLTTRSAQFSFRATIFFDPEISFPTPTPILPSTSLTTIPTTTTTTTTTTSSSCPSPSFRCRLSSQPNCGGCLNFQPCQSQGIQQCIIMVSSVQLTDCYLTTGGYSQCRFQVIQVPTLSTCQRTILLCCPNYQLISFQNQYFCIYNPYLTGAADEWSLVVS